MSKSNQDLETKELRKDIEAATREENKQLLADIGRLLMSALKTPAVSSNMDLVDDFKKLIDAVGSFDTTRAKTQADSHADEVKSMETLAAEGGRRSRRKTFREATPGEIFLRRPWRDRDSETLGIPNPPPVGDFATLVPGEYSPDELSRFVDSLR
jgi:hypothetical protein